MTGQAIMRAIESGTSTNNWMWENEAAINNAEMIMRRLNTIV